MKAQIAEWKKNKVIDNIYDLRESRLIKYAWIDNKKFSRQALKMNLSKSYKTLKPYLDRSLSEQAFIADSMAIVLFLRNNSETRKAYSGINKIRKDILQVNSKFREKHLVRKKAPSFSQYKKYLCNNEALLQEEAQKAINEASIKA